MQLTWAAANTAADGLQLIQQLTVAAANTAAAVPCDINSVHFVVLFTQKQNVGLPLEHDVISCRISRHFVGA